MGMDNGALTRFFEKVQERPDTGCWEWTARTTADGYGQFWLDGKVQYAHRVAYEHFVGTFPAEAPEFHHECFNPRCANPWHGTPVDSDTNKRLKRATERTATAAYRKTGVQARAHAAFRAGVALIMEEAHRG